MKFQQCDPDWLTTHLTVHDEPKVFISHSSEDTLFVRQIEADFRKAGIDIWVDHRGIRAGDNLPDEISQALNWCNTLLLVWSKNSAQSFWVKLEWSNALTLQKQIIPLLLDETPLPYILSHKAYVRSINIQEGMSELLRALSPSKRAEPLVSTQSSHTSLIKDNSNSNHLSGKRRSSPTVKQWILMLIVGATLITVILFGMAVNNNLFTQTPTTQAPERRGNIDTHQKRQVLLMIVDFSASLSPSQIEQVSNNANLILARMPPLTSYGIYQVQQDWDTPTALETGEIQSRPEPPALQQQEQERRERMKTAARAGSRGGGNASCIIDSLPFAQRFFGRYDPNEYQYELIYLSDMLENCRSKLIEQQVIQGQTPLTAVARNLHFREKVDLSKVRITVILPTSDINRSRGEIRPTLTDLRVFWQYIFSRCGLPEQLLTDEEEFHFSPFLPNRFK